MKIEMPAGARYIIGQLNKNGYEAFIVGGCVRDSILGKAPNDWDITTSAKPEKIKEIFRRTVDTGIQHGTVTVLVDKDAYEVTTYRVDGIYEDHRRPREVLFTVSLEEDLRRRDFTINAMAYNDEKGLIDVFGGIADLKQRVIRCVGRPEERFDEDALRILRAVRFAAQLGFTIDPDTRDAMKKQAHFLRDISAERIQVELTKLIVSDHPGMLVDAYELGLTSVFLPEFDEMMVTEQNNPHHLYTVGMHTVKVMENVPATVVLRYSALLHDVGKPACRHTGEDGIDHFYGHQLKSEEMARIILRRLKMDNNTISAVRNLVRYHDYGIGSEEIGIKAFRRFLAGLGTDNFEDFLAMRRADMAGQSDYNLEFRERAVSDMERMYQTVISEDQCLKISDLALNGRDLMELGMKPGHEMGDMLKLLLEQVLDDPGKNNRTCLTEIVCEYLKKL
ncbi:MAG: CCA tRNA nucleotidyltransferase [Wujia sp.]